MDMNETAETGVEPAPAARKRKLGMKSVSATSIELVRPTEEEEDAAGASLDPAAPHLRGRLELASRRMTSLFFACLLAGVAVSLVGLADSPFLHRLSMAGVVLATMLYPILGIWL